MNGFIQGIRYRIETEVDEYDEYDDETDVQVRTCQANVEGMTISARYSCQIITYEYNTHQNFEVNCVGSD